MVVVLVVVVNADVTTEPFVIVIDAVVVVFLFRRTRRNLFGIDEVLVLVVRNGIFDVG